MAKQRTLKLSVSQQLDGMHLVLCKLREPKALDDILQDIVTELPLPFPIRGIEIAEEGTGDFSWKALHGVDRFLGGSGIASSAVASGASRIEQDLTEQSASADTWKSLQVQSLASFPFFGMNGALTVAHPERVKLDRTLVRWLEDLAILIGFGCKDRTAVLIPQSSGIESELESIRADLELTKQEASRREQLAHEQAAVEIHRIRTESEAQIRDIEEQSAKQMRNAGLWDEATLLPNVKLFPLMITPMLAHTRRSKDLTAVMFLEVGKLEEMRQSQGFSNSDTILKHALDRVMKTLREGDVAVRAGEHRILWSLGGLHSIEDTVHVAEKMLITLSRPLEVEGKIVHLTGSIGISIFPNDGGDAETLMSFAEAALEVSRKTPGNSIRFHSREMNEKVRSFLSSRKELKEAAAKQEFVLHFQPVVRFKTNDLESVEALIRWRKPQSGTVYPIQFLALSEQIGLAPQLDEWAIRMACLQRAQWDREGLGTLRISVNLSPDFFWESDVQKIREILHSTGTYPDLLELEISERVLMKDPESAVARLNEYASTGVLLTIDDFGCGGGLFMNLSRYPVNRIKLYPEYIRGIAQDSIQAAMISSALSLAHNMKMKVVAKAVESQNERGVLEMLGCDAYQGNLFSPALPRTMLTELLRKNQLTAAPASLQAIEQTQPMGSEFQEIPVVQPVRRPEGPAGAPYEIQCYLCHQKYNANDAAWCRCITPDPSVICPHCQKCFCRATLEYRHAIWGSAPESFWDRKRLHEEKDGLPLNPSPENTWRPLILIVDDEQPVLKIASRLIREMGYSVITGQNGEEGLRLVKYYKPDLILSDALMPKMDGREMCTILKGDPETSKIKSVIMTSFSGAAKYKSSVIRDFQFDDQLQKPVEHEKLKAVLQRLLPS